MFISYSAPDRDWARQFAESLQSLGSQVWFSDWSIQPGEEIFGALRRGLEQSDIVVVLVTPENAYSPWTWFELGAAVGIGKPWIAVVSDTTDLARLPAPIRLRRFLSKRPPKEVAEELVAGISRGRGEVSPVTSGG